MEGEHDGFDEEQEGDKNGGDDIVMCYAKVVLAACLDRGCELADVGRGGWEVSPTYNGCQTSGICTGL